MSLGHSSRRRSSPSNGARSCAGRVVHPPRRRPFGGGVHSATTGNTSMAQTYPEARSASADITWGSAMIPSRIAS